MDWDTLFLLGFGIGNIADKQAVVRNDFDPLISVLVFAHDRFGINGVLFFRG